MSEISSRKGILWRRRPRRRKRKHLDVSHRALAGAEKCKACGEHRGGEAQLRCRCDLDYPAPEELPWDDYRGGL